MIIYFVNRNLAVLGLASTNLSAGYEIVDDELVESVDTGVSSLSATIAWTDETRLQLEEWAYVGNYILTENNNQAEMFTIITSETDTAEKAVTIYAENAGLDLINEIAPSYTADAPHNIEWYITEFLGDSEFKIGTNELPDTELTLSWDNTSTVTERIRSIATAFGNAEISYSFDVENLHITGKYINIWQKRGTDAGQELRLDRDINSFRVITSAEDLFTGLVVTGGTPEGSDSPITLAGYAYDDGDIFVSNGNLYSREGADRFGRMATGISYIMGTFSYDTTSQEELCSRAVEYLKQHEAPAVNYDIDIERGLDETRIGDRINLVDDKGEIYVSARILELKTSVTQNYKQATLGEYLIKSSGISDKVLELAGQFAQLANDREFLYSVSVSSSAGSYFVNTKVDTVLQASVLYAGAQVTRLDDLTIKWYSGTTLLGTGLTHYVNNETTISIICRLERGGAILAEDYITLFSLEQINQKVDNSIATDTLHYLATPLSSGVTTQTAGWTTTPQAMTATNKYLWTYHTYTKAGGTTADSVPVITGRYGEDGISVSAIQTQYYLSTSSSSLAGDSWSDNLNYIAGRYIWTREKITYSNNTTGYSTAIYNSALTNAQTAYKIASDTNQHFWFTETGTDTGAHITEVKQDVWNDTTSSNYHKGANLLLRSNGIAVRDGMDELAIFGASTARIGRETGTNTNLVATSSGINFRSGTTQFGQLSAYDSTTLGTTMQNLKLVSEPSANSYGGIKLSASSASGTGIPSEADLVAKKGSAEAGVYVTADQDSGGDHADVMIAGQNIALQVGYGDDYINVINGSSTTVATLDTSGNLDITGVVNVDGYKLITTGTVQKAGSAISGGSYGEVTVSATKNGYTPIGIIGYTITGTNAQNIVPYRMYLNGTTATAKLRNVGSNSYTPTVTFYVLYIASGQGI